MSNPLLESVKLLNDMGMLENFIKFNEAIDAYMEEHGCSNVEATNAVAENWKYPEPKIKAVKKKITKKEILVGGTLETFVSESENEKDIEREKLDWLEKIALKHLDFISETYGDGSWIEDFDNFRLFSDYISDCIEEFIYDYAK